MTERGELNEIGLALDDRLPHSRVIQVPQDCPGFPARGPHQRPLARLSIKESRMKIANAIKFDRKSG